MADCCKNRKSEKSEKTKERSQEEKKQLICRLNRISGQINGIKNMIENNAYCPDILIQVSAVNAALNAFNRELLSQHLHSCVVKDIQNGNEDAVEELSLLLKKLLK